MTIVRNETDSLLDSLDQQFVALLLSAAEEVELAQLAKIAGGTAEAIAKHLDRYRQLDALAEFIQREIRAEVDRQLSNCERPVLTLAALTPLRAPGEPSACRTGAAGRS